MRTTIVTIFLATLTMSLAAQTEHFIFLGHIYRWHAQGSKIDVRVEQLDKSNYDRIWLGGDVCSEAFFAESTVQYIDQVMDLSAPSTQYAVGNHDVRNGNMEWYNEYTGRDTYNVFSENDVVSICMNTQLNVSDCITLNEQYALISAVCDTIEQANHLFLLGHSNLWNDVPDLPSPGSYSHSNQQYWMANCDSAQALFINTIYPQLLEVRERGIAVYCVMGDAGDNHKGFHQMNGDSIHFFASGINNSKYTDPEQLAAQSKDKVLVFDHHLITGQMEWSFQDLDSLSISQ